MTRTSDLILSARVARGYYLADKSKSELADELGISRFRVARLLEAARRDGLVKIEIVSPGAVNTELSARLIEEFGMQHAVVLDLPDDEPSYLRARLGEAAAEALTELVTADSVLGLAWARSLRGIGGAVQTLPPCPVVQLTGALTGPDGSDVLELVRRVARASGGAAHVFYAPFVAADATTARTLRRQPDVAHAAAMVSQVTVAAVGIGAWAAGRSTIFDMVEPDVREQARQEGTVAEISGAFIDAHGLPVDTALSRRIIGITAPQLADIKTVLAVAYGGGKADAVRIALRSGLINVLLTHASLAREVLDTDPASALVR
ncbi:MAG: hypothetical protein QOH56_1672 [Pseudonocardiales bacterium]|jgi:DNA-binding transcriptional regulator LsrR (DeoR family)|nr:hypothetical protein [Pseudonocardiales bacterium]MDQ1735421.1 hypothetical protein [Pseudonocardiales bacterium]